MRVLAVLIVLSVPAVAQHAVPVTPVQSVYLDSASVTNSTDTAWKNTGVSITITPGNVNNAIKVELSETIQQIYGGKVAFAGFLSGGSELKKVAATTTTGGNIYAPASGWLIDWPQTTGPVTYTIGIRNDVAGGSIYFPPFLPSGSIQATELQRTTETVVPRSLALNTNVLRQGDYLIDPGFQNISGKGSPISPTITGSTFVLFAAGQSICANMMPTPVDPADNALQQLNVWDGLLYAAKDPLLGTSQSGGNWLTMLAKKLKDDGEFPRIVVVPMCSNGSSVLDWTPGGMLHQYLRVACRMVQGFGWTGNSNVKFGMIFDDGQTDAFVFSTSQANWQSRFALIKASMDGMGCPAKWFVPKDTLAAGSVSSTIQAAQAAVIDNVSVFAGADHDSYTGSTNRYDGTHPANVMGQGVANATATNIEAQY